MTNAHSCLTKGSGKNGGWQTNNNDSEGYRVRTDMQRQPVERELISAAKFQKDKWASVQVLLPFTLSPHLRYELRGGRPDLYSRVEG